jgi:hypothetical protein
MNDEGCCAVIETGPTPKPAGRLPRLLSQKMHIHSSHKLTTSLLFCRMRKAQRMETMEAKLTVLRDEITTLKAQLADKQAEIDALKRNTRAPDPTDLPTPSGTSPSRVRPPLPSQAGGARRTGRAHPPLPQQRNRSPVTRSGSLGLSGLHLAEESLPTSAVDAAADTVKPRSRKVRRGVPAPSTAAEERDKAEGEALAAAALAHFSTHAGTQGGQGPPTGALARASSLPSAPNKPMGGSPHLRVKPKPGTFTQVSCIASACPLPLVS